MTIQATNWRQFAHVHHSSPNKIPRLLLKKPTTHKIREKKKETSNNTKKTTTATTKISERTSNKLFAPCFDSSFFFFVSFAWFLCHLFMFNVIQRVFAVLFFKSKRKKHAFLRISKQSFIYNHHFWERERENYKHI